MKKSGTLRQLKKAAVQQAFLEAFRRCASVSRAAEAAGIHRDTHYGWLKDDPDYPGAFEACRDQAVEALEDEAVRRAHEGVERPVFQGGKQVGVIREYSDTLLIFMLKAVRPEKYRERLAHELHGHQGGPVKFQWMKSEELIERLHEGRARVAADRAATEDSET